MTAMWTTEELEALKRNLEHIDDSAIFLTMVSKIAENLDPQGCMELGAAVILGKPILVVAQDDSDVSDQLRAAAALIVIGSPTDGELKQKIVDAVESLIART